jgi:ABC-type uncharacterized transport system permease subunit
MTEKEEWMAGQILWETCRPAVAGAVCGLFILLALAGVWYGADGIKFWLAAIIPTWIVASIGYFVTGIVLRYLDTTIPILLLQVFGIVMLGLAATELVFPYSAGQVSIHWKTMMLVPIVVTIATMLIADDDDRIQSFLASLPITMSCVGVPFLLFAIVH